MADPNIASNLRRRRGGAIGSPKRKPIDGPRLPGIPSGAGAARRAYTGPSRSAPTPGSGPKQPASAPSAAPVGSTPRRLPPGLAKRAAGAQSARAFAPGQIKKGPATAPAGAPARALQPTGPAKPVAARALTAPPKSKAKPRPAPKMASKLGPLAKGKRRKNKRTGTPRRRLPS